MRAPDKSLRAGWFDETQRRHVKDSLAAVGIVAGDTMVNNLQGFAATVLAQRLLPGGRLPTPKQQARELRKVLVLSEQVRAFNSSVTAALSGVKLGDTLTDDKIAALHDRIDRLDAMGSASANSAHKMLGDYWRLLATIWLGLKPDAGPDQRMHLRTCLRACSWPLPPLLPRKMTEQEHDRMLDNFIKNFFRSEQRLDSFIKNFFGPLAV